MIATVKKWGNSYVVRLTAADLHRLNLREGDPVDIELRPLPSGPVDLSWLPVVHGGRKETVAEVRRLKPLAYDAAVLRACASSYG